MHDLRDDARRARVARRERVSSTPARVLAPLVAIAAVISAAAVITGLAGLPILVAVAVTAVVAIGAAAIARRTLGSLLSGLTLLLVRPYAPGERVRLYSPELGSVVDAEVVRVGIVNTTLAAATGVLVVPNTMLLHGAPEPVADLSA
jgi:small-conductance mechanosensitive channel